MKKMAKSHINTSLAGVAELADALDSKSSPGRLGCGFDSLLRHSPNTLLISKLQGSPMRPIIPFWFMVKVAKIRQKRPVSVLNTKGDTKGGFGDEYYNDLLRNLFLDIGV